MQLATLTDGIARIEDGEVAVLDLPYGDLGEVLAAGALERCRSAAVTERRPFDVARLRAPVPRPPKVVCIGINYACHLEELRSVLGTFEAPTEPVFFYVPSSAVCGPADDIVLPALAPTQVDHECELAVVIGRGGRDLDARTAWAHVAGVTLANDVSARDVQVKAMSGPMLELSHAKGFDGFKPMGPVLVTPDELSLPLDVEISCAVNGTEYQRARTTDLIFDVPACLAHVSRWVSLEPGDVVLTGSPAGVGFFQGRFMTAGDVVEVTGGGIGSLRNRLVPAASR
jgi:2-keto-4-pentenoate hydratase/2-oxohepta-3-ene-1,7-dioic acid hydratase in catechol pathway